MPYSKLILGKCTRIPSLAIDISDKNKNKKEALGTQTARINTYLCVNRDIIQFAIDACIIASALWAIDFN